MNNIYNVFYRILRAVSVVLASVLVLSSCNDKNRENVPNVRGELTISGLSDDKWTYFSFETGNTVGTSEFLSSEEDALWAQRKDWDFAICGDYLKTNSGTSGIGNGGVLKDETSNFLLLEEAPVFGYLTDETAIVK